MNYDQFSFFNKQLAKMLQDGLPLEGSLKQLCSSMGKGHIREEFERLESDLTKGTPLEKALENRDLPEMYTHMLKIGAKSNKLPAILTMLADYYQKINNILTRLKGLMIYPLILLTLSLSISLFLVFFISPSFHKFYYDFKDIYIPNKVEVHDVEGFKYKMLAPPVLLAMALVCMILAIGVPKFRNWLRWRLPAFKEVSIGQVASALGVSLCGGCTLDDAIRMVAHMEKETTAGTDMLLWQKRAAAGESRFEDIAIDSKVFPQFFVWIVASHREDMGNGFHHAAQIYNRNAMNCIEILLYVVLPVSFMLIGAVLVSQVYFFASEVMWYVKYIGI